MAVVLKMPIYTNNLECKINVDVKILDHYGTADCYVYFDLSSKLSDENGSVYPHLKIYICFKSFLALITESIFDSSFYLIFMYQNIFVV